MVKTTNQAYTMFFLDVQQMKDFHGLRPDMTHMTAAIFGAESPARVSPLRSDGKNVYMPWLTAEVSNFFLGNK
jgi:hypothetical protein